MFEKLLPYIRLGIDFFTSLLDFVSQLLAMLTSAEDAISGHQATAFW